MSEKKKFSPFDKCSCFVCLRGQNKQKKFPLSISKSKTSFFYMISLFANTLCPPVDQLFLSVTKISISFSPYIFFSGLVPMTYVLPLLRVPLHEAPDFQFFWFMPNRWTHVFIYSLNVLLYVIKVKRCMSFFNEL